MMTDNNSTTDEYLKTAPAWQADNMRLFRELVHEVYPDVQEEIKWGVPVFMCKGKTVFSMGSFKLYSKFNFMANGAQLSDPHKLFNNGLESKRSRSIDLPEGQTIDRAQLKALLAEAIEKL